MSELSEAELRALASGAFELADRAVNAFERWVTVREREVAMAESIEKRTQHAYSAATSEKPVK